MKELSLRVNRGGLWELLGPEANSSCFEELGCELSSGSSSCAIFEDETVGRLEQDTRVEPTVKTERKQNLVMKNWP